MTTMTTATTNDDDHDNVILNERTALLYTTPTAVAATTTTSPSSEQKTNHRVIVYEFIEGKSYYGTMYTKFMIGLIVINVIAFIVSTLFVEEYNKQPWASPYNNNNSNDNDNNNNNNNEGTTTSTTSTTTICNLTCDMIFFGNYKENGLSKWLHIDISTSLLELITVFIFTIDYIVRLWTVDLIDTDSTSTTSNTTTTGTTAGNIGTTSTEATTTTTTTTIQIQQSTNKKKYTGWYGRLCWIPTFFSIIDLISIVPFYIDAFVQIDFITGTAFIRMFRLLRIMKIEGRYNTALTMVDDVYQKQKSILITASFVGITTWITISSLYYITERTNNKFIYCPACASDNDEDVQAMSTCTIDPIWGLVHCPYNSTGTTTTSSSNCTTITRCYNLYESIPSASYYALLNLFGEFPHITDHSTGGKIVGTITAVVAVAVFALPVGIIGNGFEMVIEQQRRRSTKMMKLQQQQQQQQQQQGNDEEVVIVHEEENIESIREKDSVLTPNYIGNTSTIRGWLYNVFHAQIGYTPTIIDCTINFLIVSTSIIFMIETTNSTTNNITLSYIFDIYEFIAVSIFTIEYILRVYSSSEDPKYNNGRRMEYMKTFLAIVDLLSFVPYWIQKIILIYYSSSTSRGNGLSTWLLIGNTSSSDSDANNNNINSNNTISVFISSLRLLRILRFERYTHAFTTFDDVFSMYSDVLAITAYTAILCWVFFSALLYVTERDSYNIEISSNYNTLPNSMWITLLNLSGEAPLSEYTIPGKIITAIVGLFATGIFGIPIGVLGAGFEEIVEKENQDNTAELEQIISVAEEEQQLIHPSQLLTDDTNNSATTIATPRTLSSFTISTATLVEINSYNFVNGLGSYWAQQFELTIYAFIFLAVAVGCWQTVDGQQDSFSEIEWFSVILFTIEYCIRLVGVGADPMYRNFPGPIINRIRFIVSFYSIIDLLAIVPFYLSLALPNSIVNEYDEYLRMMRIIRLVKLDKYVPSITLVDDVLRLKFEPLKVAFYAAATLWILFAAALYLCENQDTMNGIDAVPKYGCVEDCTMADRFQNFFDSAYYTGVHLTGDYPIITYNWPARFVNFFMVIAAVGVVSVPSGLIASGFVEIVKKRNRSSTAESTAREKKQQAGDDWYEIQYKLLEGTEPAPSPLGPTIDRLQIYVNEFLNGKPAADGSNRTEWTKLSKWTRVFLFLIIIANVITVLLESVPAIDMYVGNGRMNFFDVFEFISVMIFATEYMLRLFCAPKNREALYSTLVYATTFFGIVDFLSTAPWFIEQALLASNIIDSSGDYAKIFRIFRIFRILQLEDFLVAFSKLDNVFRASKDVLKATGLLALIIWVGCGALFFIFEENNPNWRQCSTDIPLHSDDPTKPGCYDFASTADCNKFYPGMCEQNAFTDMPNTLYYTAVFLGGEWGVVDFTWPGRLVALFLCVVGIGLYAIPIGTLFNSFGAVLGLAEDEDEEEDEDEDENGREDGKKKEE